MTRDRRLGSAWGKGWQRGQRSPSKSSLLGRCGRLYCLSHMLHFVHTQLFQYPSLGVWHPKIRKPTMFISFGLFDVPNLWNKCWSIWQIYLRSTSTKINDEAYISIAVFVASLSVFPSIESGRERGGGQMASRRRRWQTFLALTMEPMLVVADPLFRLSSTLSLSPWL